MSNICYYPVRAQRFVLHPPSGGTQPTVSATRKPPPSGVRCIILLVVSLYSDCKSSVAGPFFAVYLYSLRINCPIYNNSITLPESCKPLLSWLFMLFCHASLRFSHEFSKTSFKQMTKHCGMLIVAAKWPFFSKIEMSAASYGKDACNLWNVIHESMYTSAELPPPRGLTLCSFYWDWMCVTIM